MASNLGNIHTAMQKMQRMVRLVELYEGGKVLAEEYEVDIPAGTITNMKQEFATLRTETKALLDLITA